MTPGLHHSPHDAAPPHSSKPGLLPSRLFLGLLPRPQAYSTTTPTPQWLLQQSRCIASRVQSKLAGLRNHYTLFRG